MPLTLEDIMEFMMKDKEERAQEREDDKNEIKELISKGVKDEVEAVMKPLNDRQLHLEEFQAEMQNKFEDLVEKVMSIREQLILSKNQNDSKLPMPLWSQHLSVQSASENQMNSVEVKELVTLARRTVGLYRVDKNDLSRMRLEQYGGAKTEDEEKELAVNEYLKFELKMDTNTLEHMDIERIFSTENDQDCLYVTFTHEDSVFKMYEKTRLMRKQSRILNYFPKQF